ncbi:hypothetical protein [Romboutsia sp. MSSM.1001216sp_RTP31141st1_F12_RTP31141_220114]|uniref:hypothetical protein n=1 Tax=Romboutsia sp. MSSM.1001216sp_RTP31141st1_F12_RTP31141_220114 TaxID=3141594 RepID=UPI0031B62D2E
MSNKTLNEIKDIYMGKENNRQRINNTNNSLSKNNNFTKKNSITKRNINKYLKTLVMN